MDSQEMQRIYKVFEESQVRARAAGGRVEDLSWGDTILNIAAGLITVDLVLKGIKSPTDDTAAKAVSTLTHADTILELVRLAEILLATPGFDSKSIVHKNEVREETITDVPEGGIMSAAELRDLFDR